MEKLNCDRRVKWRTVCSSDTSGSAGARARRKCAGMCAARRAPGSRLGGIWLEARRPGLLLEVANQVENVGVDVVGALGVQKHVTTTWNLIQHPGESAAIQETHLVGQFDM